jgi:plastocyanin
MSNQDAGVRHNIHFFGGGASIGMTAVAVGPVTETLALGTLRPGTYAFACDVHPQAMTGTLTVQ